MQSRMVTILILGLMVSSCCCRVLLEDSKGESSFNVFDFGAKGDGKSDDSQSFLKAWQALCGATGDMPTLLVPKGKTFLLSPVSFHGPCKLDKLNIQLEGDLVAPRNTWKDINMNWISFSGVKGLTIKGEGGQIDGNGDVWWSAYKGDSSRPTALVFNGCDNLEVTGVKHMNSQKNHISITSCVNVEISHIQIIAPADSPNTDGIDISYSSFVNIHDSAIATGSIISVNTGDDCVAINAFCSNINITSVTCGPGHGISVGSLGKNGAYETVSDVHVKNCTFNKSDNGARIKTWKGGAGFVREISFVNITMVDTNNPIIINQDYGSDMFLGEEKIQGIQISDVTYSGITGTSSSEEAITLDCSQVGCNNIVLNNININSSNPGTQVRASCKNANGVSNSTSPSTPCLNQQV